MSEVLLREDSNPDLSCPILHNSNNSTHYKFKYIKDDEENEMDVNERNSSSDPEELLVEPPAPKSVQQKWMDYLESFQESTPNVDVQMEEFIRVPSQLEYLLNFGFFICVDSFLYILTVLPLKFLWSILLMVSSWTGKYRFHRRYVGVCADACIYVVVVGLVQLLHLVQLYCTC